VGVGAGACRAAIAAAAVSAPAASRAPWPAPCAGRPVTPRSMACTTAAALRPGNWERISAATPAASAADISVVASVPYSPPGAATVRPEPGAVSATYEPLFVNEASWPACVVAPTASTPG